MMVLTIINCVVANATSTCERNAIFNVIFIREDHIKLWAKFLKWWKMISSHPKHDINAEFHGKAFSWNLELMYISRYNAVSLILKSALSWRMSKVAAHANSIPFTAVRTNFEDVLFQNLVKAIPLESVWRYFLLVSGAGRRGEKCNLRKRSKNNLYWTKRKVAVLVIILTLLVENETFQKWSHATKCTPGESSDKILRRNAHKNC